jgi:hypothetical protein
MMNDFDRPLTSNKSFAAHARDAERSLVEKPPGMPLDLRTLPVAQWDEYLHFYLRLPPRLLDGFDPGPIPAETVADMDGAPTPFRLRSARRFARH